MIKTFFLFLFFATSLFGLSVTNELVSNSEIDSLCEEADAVVLSDEKIFRVNGITDGEIFIKRRILVKNKNAEKYCRVSLRESKFVEVDDIEAVISDTLGNIIKELDDDDIEEAAFTPGYVLYAENTYKWFELTHKTYPYIIEYTYSLEIESLFFWPGWYPQKDIPILSSIYKLILEDNLKYKTYSIGLDIVPTRSTADGDSVLTWHASNVPPINEEDFSPPETSLQNAILFSPIYFSLGDSRGSFSDWNAVAKYFRSLYKDKFGLTKEMQAEVHDIIKSKTNPHEKVSTLYKYLQDKTRYVAIYLDIGGWEPHSAKSIYNNRYGDCKDLSILMISLLDAAGIKAYPALALTRDEGVVRKDFPSNQFNHCITFVPLEQDTIWLECTADFVEMEDTPYKIEGIDALVIKDDKGELLRTPLKAASKNMWRSIVKGKLDRKGTFSFTSLVDMTGNQKNSFKGFVGFNKPEIEKKVVLQQHTRNISTATINKYSFSETSHLGKPYRMEAEGSYKKFARSAGKRIILNPNIFNRKNKDHIPDEEIRKYPIYFNYPYVDIDSVVIDLPFGYVLEAAPEQFNIVEPFAKYSTSFKVKDGNFHYTRYFEYTLKSIDTKFYSDFLHFINQIVKTDKAKFIFKKI